MKKKNSHSILGTNFTDITFSGKVKLYIVIYKNIYLLNSLI